MKRGLNFLAVAFFLITFVASVTAEPIKLFNRIEIGGELLTTSFHLKNYKGSEVTDRFLLTRGLVFTTFNLTQDASATLLFGKTRVWGKNVTTYQVAEPGAAEYLSGEGGFLETIGIYNANFMVSNVMEGLNLTIGRQFAGDKEDAFFYYGPQKGRFLAVTSLDAIRADWDLGKIKLFGLMGKKNETGTGDGSGRDLSVTTEVAYVNDKDTDIFALEGRSDQLIKNQDLKLFLYSRRNGLASGKGDNLYLFGFRAKGSIAPLRGMEYDLMFGQNAGKNNDNGKTYAGWLGRVIGYFSTDIPSFSSLKLNAGYADVSGDKASTPNKNENFARLSRDCFYSMAVIVYEILNDQQPEAVTNVLIPFGGIELIPHLFKDKVTFFAELSKLDCDTPIMGYKHKGSETDIGARWEARDDFSLGLTYAEFKPGDLLQTLFKSKNPITQVTAEFALKF
jgi:hypothetical protein